MKKYANTLIAGLVWTSLSFCGHEDVSQFLNQLESIGVTSTRITETTKPECRTARLTAGLPDSLDADSYSTVYYRIDSSLLASDGSIIMPEGSK